MSEPAPLVRLDNIQLALRGRKILTDVSLTIQPNEIITLIGPNGAGKTTLVRVVLGLQAPDSGLRVTRPGLRIGYMPQKLHVDDTMPLTVKRFLSLTGQSTKEIRNALARTGVSKVMKSPVQALSGGEMQRVLLARALLHDPQLLVLDEPAQGVDISGQKELYQLITQLRDEKQCSVLMISHDLHLVMASTDRVICLNQHVCCSGHPSQVRQHPDYLQLFGSKSDELAIYPHHHCHEHDIDGHVINNKSTGQGENSDV